MSIPLYVIFDANNKMLLFLTFSKILEYDPMLLVNLKQCNFASILKTIIKKISLYFFYI